MMYLKVWNLVESLLCFFYGSLNFRCLRNLPGDPLGSPWGLRSYDISWENQVLCSGLWFQSRIGRTTLISYIYISKNIDLNKNCIGENHTYTFCLLVTSLYHWLGVLRDCCLWWLPLDSSKWLLRRHGCGLSGFDGLKLTKLSWLVGLDMSIFIYI